MTISVADMEAIAIAMYGTSGSHLGWLTLLPSERKWWREAAKHMLAEATADFDSPFPDGYCVLKNPEEKTAFTGFDAGTKARRDAGIGQRNHKKPILIGIPIGVETMSTSFFLGLVEPSVLRVGIKKAKEILVFNANPTILEAVNRGWQRVSASASEDVYRIEVYNVGESDAGYTIHLQLRDEDGMVTDEVDAGDFDDPISAETSVGQRGGRIVRSIWDEQAQDAEDK